MVLARIISMAAMLLLMVMSVAQADESRLTVPLNQSLVVTFDGVERVAVANPDIADVVAVSSGEVVVVGKAPGITTLHVWSGEGRQSFLVEVGPSNSAAAGELTGLLGYRDVKVSIVNKSVILEGLVRDQNEKARAEKIAAAFGDKVVNLLSVVKPLQVKLEAKIVEISRQKINNLGISWGGNDPAVSPGTFLFGQGISNSINSSAFGNLGTYSPINAKLDALVKSRLAKVLSQPNMITLSGEKAHILAGGQIPVPVSSSDGKISIEWKDYGIKMEIEPLVSGGNLISTKIKAEVSTLDWSSDHQIGIGAGLKIPPLNVRKAEAAIAVVSGQTMAIGGLISADTSRDIVKVPLLAQLPIIGNLFKSTSFSREETELIILITPTIVDADDYKADMTKAMRGAVAAKPWEEG